MPQQPRDRGMTLIEVLLAITIVGVGMVVLLSGASRCLVAIKKAQYYQQAQWILSTGEADHPLVVTNEPSEMEVFDVDYDGFTFSRRVGEDLDEDELYEIRSRVTWSERGREAFEEVTRLVYIPEEDE